MAQGFREALTYLVGNDRRGDQLRVRMLEARARVRSVILEDSHVRDARIEAQFVVASLVGTKDVGDMHVGHDRHRPRVVGRLDDDVVHAESLDRAARAVDVAGGRDLAARAANLLGTMRIFQEPSPLGRRRISGGV